ncbi:hypothetical protein EV363DRAFT_1218818, partial [Boletus edulis]
MDARHALDSGNIARNPLQIVADFRVGIGPGPRQMPPRRMQWIKTERREDRRVGLAVGHVRGGKRKRTLNMYVSRTVQPRVGSESGLHRLWAPHLPLGKII